MGLKGIAGDFAYNFVPNLGKPREQANAADYVAWAQTDPKSLTRWTPGPLNTTSNSAHNPLPQRRANQILAADRVGGTGYWH